MRRFLLLMIGILGMIGVAVGPAAATARAASLPGCLNSAHVCVASDARTLISTSQQAQLEQQIGGDDIYLVAAASGSSGYDSAMQQIIRSLNARHQQFVVGFLDSRLRHFGAYNQGILASGGAASLATNVVNQHKADGNVFAAMQDFVRDVKQQAANGSAGSGSGSSSSGSGSSSGAGNGGWIALGVIIALAAGGYFGFVRPRRIRRQRELEQELREAKSAAQQDLLALNEAITDHENDVTIRSSPEAAAEQAAALDSYERGTAALDAARRPADMGAVSRAIAEGRYRLARAEAVASGQPKPGRRPMCFFDPRHGMSVADVSWAPPDGGPSRTVAACLDCERIIERGDQPAMRTVEDRSGTRVVYVNSGFAPAYWGGFGYGGSMLTGFLLGEALASPPVAWGNPYGYGGPGYYGGDNFGGDNFGGGDFGGGDNFGGGDFGGGGDSFGGGDFGGGGGDFGGGDNFGGGSFLYVTQLPPSPTGPYPCSMTMMPAAAPRPVRSSGPSGLARPSRLTRPARWQILSSSNRLPAKRRCAMIIEGQQDVTPAVLAVMQRTADPRLREIMTSLVTHLHAFIRDVRLTEEEFRAATAILNEMGQFSSDTHNEMVLMSGSLGVSTLVCLLNNGDGGTTETQANLLGPFWRMHSPPVANGDSIVRSPTPGPALFVRARVQDRAGDPVAGAEVDVWHSSPIGLYEHQDDGQADMNLRGKLVSDSGGRFWFRTVKMAGYPIPTHTVVGRLLKAQDRHPFRPAHLHVLIFKEGFKTLISQVYAPDDPHLGTDVQFGVTRALIGDFREHHEAHPADPGVEAPWWTLDITFTLEPGAAVLPRPPIK